MPSLTQQFSREKSLLYFCMWDRSDRTGFARYAGYALQHNLFHCPDVRGKVHVYYAKEELQALFVCVEQAFRSRPTLWSELVAQLEASWAVLSRYLHTLCEIPTPEDFCHFFQALTDWWTAMAVVFYLPDISGVSEDVRRQALAYREQGEKYTEDNHRIMERFWDRHASQDHANLFSVVTPEELSAILRGDMPPEDVREIRKRRDGYGMFNGQIYPLSTLDEVLRANDISFDHGVVVERMDEVRGRTAQPGFARGKARVIIHNADLSLIRPGDVIVAEMTNPDYVPWLKDASAIVTDEGGMTCHAAIVSREMGKPCIVGTRVATKMFQSGDELEVDATNGVVRRIVSTDVQGAIDLA